MATHRHAMRQGQAKGTEGQTGWTTSRKARENRGLFLTRTWIGITFPLPGQWSYRGVRHKIENLLLFLRGLQKERECLAFVELGS